MADSRDPKETEKMLKDTISRIRKDPEMYKKLRKKMQEAKTDKDKAKYLTKFITDEKKLGALMPGGKAGTKAATWTTITVTTVTIPSTANRPDPREHISQKTNKIKTKKDALTKSAKITKAKTIKTKATNAGRTKGK